MVDALREARRILRPRGILVDARPDSRVVAYAEHGTATGTYRQAGVIATSHEELVNDRSSDDAVATAVGSGWFRSRGAGRFWHRVRWRVDPATRRRWDEDPWAIRRAVRHERFERL